MSIRIGYGRQVDALIGLCRLDHWHKLCNTSATTVKRPQRSSVDHNGNKQPQNFICRKSNWCFARDRKDSLRKCHSFAYQVQQPGPIEGYLSWHAAIRICPSLDSLADLNVGAWASWGSATPASLWLRNPIRPSATVSAIGWTDHPVITRMPSSWAQEQVGFRNPQRGPQLRNPVSLGKIHPGITRVVIKLGSATESWLRLARGRVEVA